MDADQVRLYRYSWSQAVAARRSTSVEETVAIRRGGGGIDAQLVTSLVEVDRDAGNWVNLAFLYESIGNEELRDKAADQAIAAGVTDEVLIMLRRVQGRVTDIPPETIDAELTRLAETSSYRGLAVLYEDLGQYRKAAEVYVRGLAADLTELEDFPVGHHLQELLDTEIIPGLFVQALESASDEDNLWWQVRALQELGWTSEIHALVLANESRIDTDPDLEDEQRVRLRLLAAEAKGDEAGIREARVMLERLDAEIDWNS